MKHKKISLKGIEVQSFVTSLDNKDQQEILGGAKTFQDCSSPFCTGANCPVSGIRNCFESISVCISVENC